MEISKDKLYSLLHKEACVDAKYRGWMDRYMFQHGNKPKPEDVDYASFWKGDELGIEMEDHSLMPIKWLYAQGWNDCDFIQSVRKFEKDSNTEIEFPWIRF